MDKSEFLILRCLREIDVGPAGQITSRMRAHRRGCEAAVS